MQILTPEEVKKGSTAAEDELRARVRDLSAEEERLVASVNHLRQEDKEEFRKKSERESADQGVFATRKTVLEGEVDALEARKKEALRPIKDIEEEARGVLSENRKETDRLVEWSASIKEKESELTEATEKVSDDRQLLEERSRELDQRQAGIDGSKREVERSTVVLRGKWVEYHEVAAVANEREADLVQRENRASASEQANEIRAGALDDRERDLAGRERLLRSNYQALEEAKKHLGIQ